MYNYVYYSTTSYCQVTEALKCPIPEEQIKSVVNTDIHICIHTHIQSTHQENQTNGIYLIVRVNIKIFKKGRLKNTG